MKESQDDPTSSNPSWGTQTVAWTAFGPGPLGHTARVPSSHDGGSDPGRSPTLPEWETLARDQPQSRFGPFVLGRLLGEGGMGMVYQAFDPQLGHVVALKLMRRQDPALLARFQREARAQAKVEHPNICKVFEVGQIDSLPFIAMQFIEGGDLAALGASLRLDEKVRIMTLAAEALEAAHQAGLIHRDIKPSNIMLEHRKDGWAPFLLDFGLAKDQEGAGLTLDDRLLGTPAYMSPEQAMDRAGRIDVRADVYALGATLYFLLANRPPFKEPNAAQTLVALSETEAPDLRQLVPRMPVDLAIIVHKCLEKEPDRRYASARLLAEDLRRFAQGEPILARPASLGYHLGKKIRKNPAASLALATAFVLAMAATAWNVRASIRTRAQGEMARRFGEQVKDLEWSLRVAHLLPCHDLSGERERTRAAMAAIRAQMEAHPGVADAPGSYALGRGHLVLGEFSEAQGHLLRAWTLGARSPEVAEALGLALGERYRARLAEAAHELTRDAQAASRAEAERQFREPALNYIRLAGDSPYLKGLVAFYEGRNADAGQLAGLALAADPAFFEALKLHGDAALAEAEAATNRGETGEAKAAVDRAGKAYGQALDIARSEPDLYRAEAGRCLLGLKDSRLRSGGPAPELLRRALELLDRALVCEPASAATQLAIAKTWSAWAEELRRTGQSPLEANRKALEAARKASRTDPGTGPLVAIASLLRSNAEYVRYHGGDPDTWMSEAAAMFRRAVAQEPGSTSALRGLLLLCFVAADDARRRGRDPQLLADEGMALSSRLIVLQPALASNFNWMAGLAGAQAEYLMDHGRDPESWFQRSLAAFGQGLAVNPRDASLLNNASYYSARYAEWQLHNGRPDGPTLNRALDFARRTLLENPRSSLGYGTFAMAARIRAEAYFREGRDPLPLIQEGLAACRKGGALDPDFYDNPLQAGQLELLKARCLAAKHQDSGPSLALAVADLARARRLNRLPSWETELAMAQALLIQAGLSRDRGPALRASARQLLNGVARLDPGLGPLRKLQTEAGS